MGRHSAPRRLGAGQLAVIAVAGAVVAGAAGAGIVHMAGGGSDGFENAASTATASPSSSASAMPGPLPTPGATAADGGTAEADTGGARPEDVSGANTSADPVPRSAVATVAGPGGELVATRVVAGRAVRVLSGLLPVRWFANGTLLLQGHSDRGETVVYDPVAGKYLARIPYGYGGKRLAAQPGAGAAPQSFFVPEQLVAGPDSPLDTPVGAAAASARLYGRTLVEISDRLEEKRTRLPAGNPRRDYRPGEAVRVGDAVFVPYGRGFAADARGILRIEGGRTTKILTGRHIERLAVSSDYRHLVALVRVEKETPGTAGDDPTTLRLVAVDPGTGDITRRVRLPEKFGRDGVEVGLIDRVGPRYAVQLNRACRRGTGERCEPGPTATWRWQAGNWAPVAGTADNIVLWQSREAALTWRLPDGPVLFLRDGRRREVHTHSDPGVLAPGSLLRPEATQAVN